MKKRKSIMAILIVLTLFLNFSAVQAIEVKETVNENELRYYSIILGTTIEEVIKIKNEASKEEFETIIDSMLEGRKYTDDMYNAENNIDISAIVLSTSVSECSELFGISEQEVVNDISVCGKNVYNKVIEDYHKRYIEINVYGGGGEYEYTVSEELWNKFCNRATTGNIYITKDSINVGYRHGHVGVIQSHTGTTKYITEAMKHDDPNKQVICRPLNDPTNNTSTYWQNRHTLCAVFPHNVSAAKRTTAGNQTGFYAGNALYTYEILNTKAKAEDHNHMKLNCVGVAYRAYFYKADYIDLIPQVDDNSIMLPSHIYYSNQITLKRDGDDGVSGNQLKTPGFDAIDWGW